MGGLHGHLESIILKSQRRLGLLALCDVHHHRTETDDLTARVSHRIPALIPSTGYSRDARCLASELMVEHWLAGCDDLRCYLTQGGLQRWNDFSDGLSNVRRNRITVYFSHLIVDPHETEVTVKKHKAKWRVCEQSIEMELRMILKL